MGAKLGTTAFPTLGAVEISTPSFCFDRFSGSRYILLNALIDIEEASPSLPLKITSPAFAETTDLITSALLDSTDSSFSATL